VPIRSKSYSDVEVASEDDIKAGEEAALARLGLTYDQLAEMARKDEFTSEEARLVWFVISPEDGAVC